MRQEVRDLGAEDAWNPTVLAYANAIATMQARAPEDPTSWSYQAGIHGFSGPARPLFNECQHQTWFFLPWHRLYLWRFEQIVRATVVANGGPADWALPYWDYERDSSVPWAFRQEFLPDGSPNPLLVLRDARRNDGVAMPAPAIESATALAVEQFGPSSAGSMALTFGGANTTANHFGSFSSSGALELTPHNSVHVQLGGLMANPNTAAQDPIFWLHHANIDRLWEVWNRLGNRTTGDPGYENQRFGFFTADGVQRATRCGDALDIDGQLGYTYANLPVATPGAFVTGADAGIPRQPAQMIGATEAPITLADAPASAEIAMEATSSFDTGSGFGRPSRMYLNLSNVTADAPPSTSYLVIVDMGTPDDDRDDFVVGTAAFFGAEQASVSSGTEPAHGLSFTYDITTVVARLQARGLWDESRLKVSFAPLEEVDGPATDVSVGSIRVFSE